MDIFVEKIVKRKNTSADLVFNIGIILGGIGLAVIVLLIPYINNFGFILVAGIIYGVYYLQTSRSVEYEYVVTNGDLDIDKIVSKRKRKRVFSASCKEFDMVARITNESLKQEVKNAKKQILAVSSMEAQDVYFVSLNYKSERTLLFFEPDQRMIDAFKIYIPKKVFE